MKRGAFRHSVKRSDCQKALPFVSRFSSFSPIIFPYTSFKFPIWLRAQS